MSSSIMVHTDVTLFRETTVDLMDYAKAHRDEGIFNDITLQVDNLSIGANRLVLACCSTYFETMFKSKFKERYEPNISIVGVDGKTATTLVDYIYTGKITIANDSVMDILAGADYFQLDEVKQYCLEYLMNQITSNNWYAIQTAANLYELDQLQKHVNKFVSNHFDEIVENSDFKTLTKKDLSSFVFNLNRGQVNESSLFHAIINWVKHSEQERKKEFPDLFQLINLESLSPDGLQDVLLENLVQENVACAKSLLSLFSMLIKKTKKMKNESKIIMIGGNNDCEKVVEIFNRNCTEPKNYPDLPYGVFGHCLLKLNDVVFCIGGGSTNRKEIYDKVCQMKLNDTNLKWSDAVSMNEKRGLFGAAVFSDHLVVAGGGNGNKSLTLTEYFIASTGKWQIGPCMQRRKLGFCLVECNDCLFAFGGQQDDECLSCVECLQSLNGQWEFVAPMLEKRDRVAGVSLNGYIYAIGGKSESDLNSGQKTVERYNPKLNNWSYVCEMNYVRSLASACVLNGRIFVAGGIDVQGELVENIECYDPAEDKWEIVQFPQKCESRFGGVLVTI